MRLQAAMAYLASPRQRGKFIDTSLAEKIAGLALYRSLRTMNSAMRSLVAEIAILEMKVPTGKKLREQTKEEVRQNRFSESAKACSGVYQCHLCVSRT